MSNYLKTIISFFIFILLTGISPARAGDLTFSLDQKEYYFKIGENAVISLHIKNTLERPISGTLTYTATQDIRQGGVSFSSSNSNSTSLNIDKGERTMGLDFGTSDSPATYKIKIAYYYEDKEPREVSMPEILIHFVSDKSKIKNQSSPVESSSQKSMGVQNPNPGGLLDEFDRMQKEMDERMQEHQQRMEQMLRNHMPQMPQAPPQQPGKTSRKLPNNQMPQDSSGLKQQIDQQLKKQEQLKNNFQENLAKNEDFQKKHQELTDKGFKPEKENYNPTSPDTGSFDIYYKNNEGKSATLKGEMKNNKMENIESFTPEDQQKLLNKLKENNEFKKLSKQLEKRGFRQEDTQVEKSGNSASASLKYKDDKGRNASIKANFINDEVKSVELEDPSREEAKVKSPFIPVLLLILLFILAFIIFNKYFKKKSIAENLQEIQAEEPFDYRLESKKLLENAKRLFEEGYRKDAYGEAGRAMRLYLCRDNGLDKEKTNDELIDFLIGSGKPWHEIKECLDLCSLVEFAKYSANREDFERILKIAEKTIS